MWLLLAIYASTDYKERRLLWHKAGVPVDQGIPTIMAGDFNCITSQDEKIGGRPFSPNLAFQDFLYFLNSNSLVDLGFTGNCFTWCNNRFGTARVWKRIDKAFANLNWLQVHPDFFVKHLSRIASDHCPLLLSTDTAVLSNPPFRFEKFWLGYPRLDEIVRDV